MKPFNMSNSSKIKLSTLAVTLAFSTAALSETQGNYAYTNDWQSSLAKDFTKLDASGNGLLMPTEASKGKAFNRKTFAAADTDKDGTIDQTEYINYKTSMGATNQPGTASTATTTSSSSMSDNGSASVAEEMPMTTNEAETMPADKTAEMSKDTTETKNRPVGAVIDDSLITTKAKAAIFGTPDLKTLQISVETRQGEVTLSGMVDSAAAKMKAEEVVKSVEGVNSVTNNLEVKG